jgi:hypothetical protein
MQKAGGEPGVSRAPRIPDGKLLRVGLVQPCAQETDQARLRLHLRFRSYLDSVGPLLPVKVPNRQTIAQQ